MMHHQSLNFCPEAIFKNHLILRKQVKRTVNSKRCYFYLSLFRAASFKILFTKNSLKTRPRARDLIPEIPRPKL